MSNRFNVYRLFSIYVLFLLGATSSLHAKGTMIVDVIRPVISTNSQILTISGTLSTDKQSLLSPRVDGLIQTVYVDAGSRVKKGDVLVKLDSTMSQYALKQIKANVIKAQFDRDEAQRLLKEAEKLVARKHIPETELGLRKANFAIKNAEFLSVKASQATAEETLRRHDIIAPFSGVISSKRSEAGEWVGRGDTVLELVSLDNIRLDINVPQERFTDIKQGMAVRVMPDIYPNQSLKGAIEVIVPVSTGQVRAFLVRVKLENNSLSLLPGTSATAELAVKFDNDDYLSLPRDALLNDPDGSHSVFIIKEDKALRRKVTLGRMTEDGVTILSGIERDDVVVIRGNEVLHDQQAVKINQIRH